jgi:subtilisin-like proprotein convertase family protein
MSIVTPVRGRVPARPARVGSASVPAPGGTASSRRRVIALVVLGALLALALALSAAPAGAAVFSSTGAMTIPSQGQADPYPSQIAVSGLNGTITKVTVTLSGLTHTFPGDLDILLVGPTGSSVVLITDWGAGTDVNNVDLTFDDWAPQMPAPIVSGTWHTMDRGIFNGTPPAPGEPRGVALSIFRDTSPNGAWDLYVYDDLAGDSGSLTGWSLDITVSTPVISGFAPAAASAGSTVKVFGTALTGATAVAFNGTPATSFAVDSDTQITATVPAGATTGPISVTTGAGAATSAADFTVLPAPLVSGFTPAAGPVGTAVTVSGAGFTGATAVTFGGTPATSFTVVSDTQITATVPAGATTGLVSVAVGNGAGVSATKFTVVVPYRFTLRLSGLASGALMLGDSLSAKGAIHPADFGGGQVRLTVQRKRGSRWTKTQAVVLAASTSGDYEWQYKPAARGAYRVRGTIAPSSVNTLATTPWHRFAVK